MYPQRLGMRPAWTDWAQVVCRPHLTVERHSIISQDSGGTGRLPDNHFLPVWNTSVVRNTPTGVGINWERYSVAVIGFGVATVALIAYARDLTSYTHFTNLVTTFFVGCLAGWRLQFRFTKSWESVSDTYREQARRWRGMWFDCMDEMYVRTEGTENDPFGEEKPYTTISLDSDDDDLDPKRRN